MSPVEAKVSINNDIYFLDILVLLKKQIVFKHFFHNFLHLQPKSHYTMFS